MTRIFTIIALLFATPAWAGEVDGNSFYCKPNDNKTVSHQALKFEDGKVFRYDENGLELPLYYSARPSNVTWSPNMFMRFHMDRKTLRLKLISDDTIAKFALPDSDGILRWQCEFMEIDQARKLVMQPKKLREEKEREGNQF